MFWPLQFKMVIEKLESILRQTGQHMVKAVENTGESKTAQMCELLQKKAKWKTNHGLDCV